MNILAASDVNYLGATAVMLYSLKRNSREVIDFYLLHSDIDNDMLNSFVEEIENYGIIYHDLPVDKKLFDGFSLNELGHLKIETYYRFLAPLLLPSQLDRILWLDSDIVVNGDLSIFYSQDINNYLFVACEDYGISISHEYKSYFENEGIEPHNNKYANAGVILINLVEARKKIKLDDIVKCSELGEKLVFNDQDIINILYGHIIKYEDGLKYNFQMTTHSIIVSRKAAMAYAIIFHYIGGGRCKPWHVRYAGDRYNLVWWKYAKHTSYYKKVYLKYYFFIHYSFYLSKLKKFVKLHVHE